MSDYPDSPPTLGGGAYDRNMIAKQVQESGIHLGSMRNPPVRMIVEAQITELEKQLEERRALLKDLDRLPEVEQLLDRMRKLSI